MSASNWTKCPRCEFDQRIHAATLRTAADEAYGKVSAAEFEERRAAALAAEAIETKSTFREDYEIGAYSGGVLYISYSGWCSVCSLSTDFKHEERFYTPAPRC
jgi:hypothetical protein